MPRRGSVQSIGPTRLGSHSKTTPRTSTTDIRIATWLQRPSSIANSTRAVEATVEANQEKAVREVLHMVDTIKAETLKGNEGLTSNTLEKERLRPSKEAMTQRDTMTTTIDRTTQSQVSTLTRSSQLDPLSRTIRIKMTCRLLSKNTTHLAALRISTVQVSWLR
jgi:multidrug efflux pump subunit AcrB